MAYSDAQKEATARYNKKAYDFISVVVPKGKRKQIADYAASQGKSMNRFINDAPFRRYGETGLCAQRGDSFRRGLDTNVQTSEAFALWKGGKGRLVTVWCVLRVWFRQVPILKSLRTHIVTPQALWYAPPVTELQICE